jgi:hypothetical protein
MSRNNKILWGVVVLSILLCLVPCLYVVAIGDPAHRASTYGIEGKGKSALVIQNNTSDFYILDLKLDGEIISTEVVDEGDQVVVEIPSGKHELKIHYSDYRDLSTVPSFTFYVSSVLTENFSVSPGRAVIYSIDGGDVSGMFYDPPELNGK